MKTKIIYFLPLLCCLTWHLQGQVNFLGKPGLMTIPSASWEQEQQLGLSFSHVPKEYSESILYTIHSSPEGNDINFYSARIRFLTFMELNLTLSHRPSIKEHEGVGDRQLDFRFHLLKERKYFPSLVLGWTPPGSVAPVIAHDYLVATKNFNSSVGSFAITAGYGSPYVFIKNINNDNIFNYFEARKKTDLRGSRYLSGIFGGLKYQPVKFGGLMFEYNTRTFNTGAYFNFKDWLHLQAYTFEGKEWAFQLAVNFPLDLKPRALRRYEEALD